MPLKKWKKISSREFAVNKYWSYLIDRFSIEGGVEGEYHYVHTAGSTMIIPVTEDGKILLVKQFRYLNNKESVEFPAGSVGKGVDIKENAQKELQEETGYFAKDLEYIGKFAPYTGAADEECSLFIGKNLIKKPLPKDDTEDFELLILSPEEISRMVEDNSIWDGMTLASWALAKKYF